MIHNIIYVSDAWPGIGMGHLARALGVVRELGCGSHGVGIGMAGRFSDSARAFLEQSIPDDVNLLDEDDPGWSARVLVLDTMAEPGNPSAINLQRVVDLKRRCSRLVLISSSIEVETAPEIDVLIDHMPRVEILGPRPTRCHFGLEFAPVAAEFFDVETLPVESADTLVAIIGGSDEQIGPERVAGIVGTLETSSFRNQEMVVSPHYPGNLLDEFRLQHPSWVVHQNLPSVVPVLERARAVVCTYGNATYESLALGRPTFVLGYRKFQWSYANSLEAMGLVLSCGLFGAEDREKLGKIDSMSILGGLARRARESGIGCGVRSIAQVLGQEMARVQDA